MSHELIPEALRTLDQWHVWRDQNGVKIPLTVNGTAAKSNDPSTWTDFQTALDASLFFTGLAFEIANGLTGIDLDDCLDEQGNLKEWAFPIVARLDGVAYGEVSPSGRGMKFLTFAQKPPGSRCLHKIGEGKEAIECYDKARFWTVTGDVFNLQTEIGDGQAAIDWICQEYLTPTIPQSVAPSHTFSPGFGDSDLMQRANAYLEQIPQAGKGERNSAAFSLAGHLMSITGDYGERLSVDQLQDLMRDWNSRNGEPLPDAELMHATESASRNGTARAPKSPQLFTVNDDDEEPDLSGLLGTLQKTAGPVGEFPPGLLDAPGLLGDIVQHNLRTAIYPLPELAFAGALSLMSTITGGKVAKGRSRTNLYTMGLAPSGSGKDHARVINAEILTAIGREDICGPERIGSHAGIVTTMSEHWQQLLQIDEVNRLFATMQNAQQSPHLYNITTVLLQIYGSTGRSWTADAYGDSKKQKKLMFPHCVLYGTGVPDGFWESVTKAQLTEGLIGRFLIFEEPEYVPWRDASDEALPQSIIDRARAWVEYKPEPSDGSFAALQHDAANPRQIELTPGARERLDGHAKAISNRRMNEAPVEAAIWSRQAEKTNKIAVLLACSRWDGGEVFPVVTEEDADRAVTLHNWLTRRMLTRAGLHIAENQIERDSLRMLRLIQSRKEWGQSALSRASRWLKARERKDIVDNLIFNGDVISETFDTDGRKKTVLRAKV